MAANRIYVVKSKGSENDPIETALVRANSPSAALRHIAREVFTVGIPTQDELFTLASQGVSMQVVGTDEETDDVAP